MTKQTAQSRNAYRLRSNSLEQRFVDEWNRINKYYHTAEYVLSGYENLSDHDQEIAVTLVQWLGTPVGCAFLEKVLGIPDLRTQIQSKSEQRDIQTKLDQREMD